jgi:hypothetical protein
MIDIINFLWPHFTWCICLPLFVSYSNSLSPCFIVISLSSKLRGVRSNLFFGTSDERSKTVFLLSAFFPSVFDNDEADEVDEAVDVEVGPPVIIFLRTTVLDGLLPEGPEGPEGPEEPEGPEDLEGPEGPEGPGAPERDMERDVVDVVDAVDDFIFYEQY